MKLPKLSSDSFVTVGDALCINALLYMYVCTSMRVGMGISASVQILKMQQYNIPGFSLPTKYYTCILSFYFLLILTHFQRDFCRCLYIIICKWTNQARVMGHTVSQLEDFCLHERNGNERSIYRLDLNLNSNRALILNKNVHFNSNEAPCRIYNIPNLVYYIWNTHYPPAGCP